MDDDDDQILDDEQAKVEGALSSQGSPADNDDPEAVADEEVEP